MFEESRQADGPRRESFASSTQITEASARGLLAPSSVPPILPSLMENPSDPVTQTQMLTQTQGSSIRSTGDPFYAVLDPYTVLCRLVGVLRNEHLDIRVCDREIYIGRNPGNNLIVKDKNVSGRHCRIFRDDKGCWIQDFSVNGTYVNGTRVKKEGDQPTLLQSGDEISLVQNSFKPSERAYHVYMYVEPMSNVGTSFAVDPSDVNTHYHMGRLIGKGNFSEVYFGVKRTTGERVAIKAIDAQKTEQFSRKSKSVAIGLDSEMTLLQSLDHVNIIRFFGMFRSPTKLYLVIELCDGGDLLNRILDHGPYPESEGKRVFCRIAEGIAYLHANDVVHRDLKPDNILLTHDGGIKISDFGLARHSSTYERAFQTYCGTPHYFAPEMFMLQRNQVSGYGKAIDVWSLGVILYIIVSGRPPFDDENLPEQITKGLFGFDGPEFEKVSDECKDLITKLMTVDPEKRLTVVQALVHPWVTGVPQNAPSTPLAGLQNKSATVSTLGDAYMMNAENIRERQPLAESQGSSGPAAWKEGVARSVHMRD